MKSFIALRPHDADFTPADLMLAFAAEAKSNYIKPFQTRFFEQRLMISGVEYKYHHWQIDALPGGIDRITLFLEEVQNT